MVLSRILLFVMALSAFPAWSDADALSAAPAAQPQPLVKTVRVLGAQELDERSILTTARVRVDEPLPDSTEAVAQAVQERYRDEGYTFAEVRAEFDEPTGTLTLTVDEGQIDEVEFTGIGEPRARTLAEDFAIRAGDVFNRTRAAEALSALLRPSRGALRPARDAFDLIRRNGRRVLVVGVDQRAGAFRTTVDMGEREDWFTPVDGLVPALGFGGAVFDQKRFNHAYIAAHVSYKMASGRAGYALGFERPLFRPVTVYVGGELYDLTATDDRWQISGAQASLSAMAARESVRDYYRRRGVQLHSAVRANRHFEVQVAWRGERHEALAVESDFSFWNGDEDFRPNRGATAGKLNAMLIGASFDSIGVHSESLAGTYRRHQLDTTFGQPLRHPDAAPYAPVWRLDWTTEISTPAALGSDFDFRRHIVSGRAAVPLSAHEEFRARVIGGWSQGTVPLQRLFSLGGIGSVHGYGFKEATGDRMALINLEYAIGKLNGFHIAPFFDAGRTGTSGGSSAWLRGVGFGIGLTRDIRIDVGYKLNDFPGSAQVLLRLGRTF